MEPQYHGNYPYNQQTIEVYSPDTIGVYYIGCLNSRQELVPLYIGKAAGMFTSIRSRLLDHLRDKNWRDTTHFGYKTCASAAQAEEIEAREIRNLQPKYNTVGKAMGY